MSEDRKITDTVWQFLDRVGPMYARMHQERFVHEMQANCIDCGMESPIEDLFWIACHALCAANLIDVNPCPGTAREDGDLPCGIYISPQRKIDKYRVDFLVTHRGYQPIFNDASRLVSRFESSAVVELDGHDFHDKDKRQRSYEKRRDRDLQRAGYKVLHFTGSDMVKDPFACAREALELVGVNFFGDEYEASDPLGLRHA